MIDLSREFQVLAAHLNFTTAARELNMSQPGLSRHIGELEQRLGFKLLERNPVRLTAAGNHYLKGISQVIERVDGLVAECREIAVRENSELVISMVVAGDGTTEMVYDAFAALSEEYPEFSYRFDNDRQSTIETAVASSIADVGILFHLPDDLPNGLTVEHVFDDPFSAWLHQTNPLAGREVSFADLSACTVVLSANRKFQTWVDGMRSACKQYGCDPQFRMKNVDAVADFFVSLQRDETVFCSASLGDYPSRINSRLVKARIASSEPLTYPVYLIYKEKSLNPVLDAFIERFKEVAERRRTQAQ